jgi:glycosyltransferase involved in cell wall biosynthesis
MKPHITVIIATYNRAYLLKMAIDSVLSQTYSNYELIVVDDGSTDETSQLAQSYGDKLQYLYQENQGKSVALNNALAIARGEWIAFLDSDDYWLPEKLEWQVKAIDQCKDQGCGACFTDGQFVNNPQMDTTLFKFYGRKYNQTIEVMSHPARTFADTPAGVSVVTLLCRADLARKAGWFDPKLHFTEDYDFVFRLSLVTNYCLVNIPLAIIDRSRAAVRHSGASAVWDKIDFRLETEQQRYEKWLALTAGQPREIQQIILQHLRAVHSGWANWYLENGEFELAQKSLTSALKYHLTVNLLAKWILARFSPRFAKRLVAQREGFSFEVF